MAAKSKLSDLNVSLEFSSSANSVEAGKSDQEYTEDFHSSLQSSVEEISEKLTEISADYSLNIDDVDDRDRRLSEIFVDKKLKVLRENHVKSERIENSTDDHHDHKDLGPFLLKKVGILRQKNASNRANDNKHSMSNVKCGNRRNQFVKFNIKTEANENEIGCFQSAYERLNFENLREKCRGLLNTEIHSLETCEKCQKLQSGLVKDRFYTSCVRNVRRNNVKERFSEHMQNRSSAMLIANIIEDGPRPSWSSVEIWAKLFSGGYQSNQQN